MVIVMGAPDYCYGRPNQLRQHLFCPARLYFDLETFKCFFWRGKLHREENISFSDERQMQAVAKSNFRSKKVLKEVVARYIAILVLECFHSDIP